MKVQAVSKSSASQQLLCVYLVIHGFQDLWISGGSRAMVGKKPVHGRKKIRNSNDSWEKLNLLTVTKKYVKHMNRAKEG